MSRGCCIDTVCVIVGNTVAVIVEIAKRMPWGYMVYHLTQIHILCVTTNPCR